MFPPLRDRDAWGGGGTRGVGIPSSRVGEVWGALPRKCTGAAFPAARSVTTRPERFTDAQTASGLLDLRPYLLSLLSISFTEHPFQGLVLLEEAKMNNVPAFTTEKLKKLLNCLSKMLSSPFTY